MRTTLSLCLAALLLNGCNLLRSTDLELATQPDAAAANNMPDDGAPTTNGMDSGAPDAHVPDLGESDMSVIDGMPDMPRERAFSAVCDGTPPSQVSGRSDYRLRVASSGPRIFAAWVRPTVDALVLGHFWSQWDPGPLWISISSLNSLNNPGELRDPNITGAAVLPVAGTGFTDVFVTRTPTTGSECLYGEFGVVNQTMECDGAWGAEATNTAGTPRYFWFGANGTIGSTPVDDFGRTSQQFIVPWCAQNPNDPTSCLSVSLQATDARGNRGPNVLLSDAEGRAYLWDTVQDIDGTAELIDCTSPPTAPVPLMLQGAPVLFDNADVVRLDDGIDYLVHQTEANVSIHPLDTNLQPLAASHVLPNAGLRPHFDAASDGTRIAAAAGVNADVRLFAFGPGGSTRDEVVDDNTNFAMLAVGVVVLDDKVGVLAGGNSGNPRANAFTMWSD